MTDQKKAKLLERRSAAMSSGVGLMHPVLQSAQRMLSYAGRFFGRGATDDCAEQSGYCPPAPEANTPMAQRLIMHRAEIRNQIQPSQKDLPKLVVCLAWRDSIDCRIRK